MSKLPHTVDFNKMGMADIALLDPNDTANSGPISRKREFRVIPPNAQFPLLQGWSEHFQSNKFFKPDHSVEQWDQARWDRGDEEFLRRLPRCDAPEEVDEIMPDKWRPHRKGFDSDPRLERVTKLCTTMVNRLVDWQLDRPGGWKPQSVSDWKSCQAIEGRIAEMLRFLEATLGEAVGIAALKDPSFVRRCWRSMSEADHSSFEDSIEQSAAFFNNNQNHNGGGRDDDATTEDSFQLNRNDNFGNNNNQENMMMMSNNNNNNSNYARQQQQQQGRSFVDMMATRTIPNNTTNIINRTANNTSKNNNNNNNRSNPVSAANSRSRANSTNNNVQQRRF